MITKLLVSFFLLAGALAKGCAKSSVAIERATIKDATILEREASKSSVNQLEISTSRGAARAMPRVVKPDQTEETKKKQYDPNMSPAERILRNNSY